jgi:hypothetical protein
VTAKLLFTAILILVMQAPLHFVSQLRDDRGQRRALALVGLPRVPAAAAIALEGYRMR